MNSIGGSGDLARNTYISMFLTPSTARNEAISSIVPMVSPWTTPSTTAPGKHAPHLIDEALSWHARYLREGTMRPR